MDLEEFSFVWWYLLYGGEFVAAVSLWKKAQQWAIRDLIRNVQSKALHMPYPQGCPSIDLWAPCTPLAGCGAHGELFHTSHFARWCWGSLELGANPHNMLSGWQWHDGLTWSLGSQCWEVFLTCRISAEMPSALAMARSARRGGLWFGVHEECLGNAEFLSYLVLSSPYSVFRSTGCGSTLVF